MNLALFDFDGTITNRDTFTAFLHLSYLEVAFNRMNNGCKVHQLYKCVIIRG